ncbi:MAG TPA: M23 family metallopeptidase [Anaerolineae bacterium]|nr:M23 family metallopeptidase [Anaerolineae bacterium]
MKIVSKILAAILVALLLLICYYFIRYLLNPLRLLRVQEWIRHPEAHSDWAIRAKQRCSDAPFMMPTDGYIGFLWGDSFRPGHHHQGIDIFGGEKPGLTPVFAAYDGFLTRLPHWKSTVIIRIPSDPLNPGSQIWTYYTHLADEAGGSVISAEFPPGTSEVFVTSGTFLGYQGNYSGTSNHPVGVHLHFSIVLDDGEGHFLNELEIKNTLDPSPYFKLELNAKDNKNQIPLCQSPD